MATSGTVGTMSLTGNELRPWETLCDLQPWLLAALLSRLQPLALWLQSSQCISPSCLHTSCSNKLWHTNTDSGTECLSIHSLCSSRTHIFCSSCPVV
ncbi:hypothetical protein AOLI_G00008300 [Acnodon oligacanthus]